MQLYVGDPASSVTRPLRELKGFDRVELEPGATGEARIVLDVRAFSFWSVVHHRWVVEAGDFVLHVGTSSRDLPHAHRLHLDAPSIAAPLGPDSTLHEWLADPRGAELLATSVDGGHQVEATLLQVIGSMPLSTLAGFGMAGFDRDLLDSLVARLGAEGLMRAVVYDAYGARPEVREIDPPSCPADGVVVRVQATGVCRSDWHAWRGHDPVPLPMVPGHELAGILDQVGDEVSGWSVGDRVTVPFVIGCGRCEFCAGGEQNVCPDQVQPGFTYAGSWAELVAVPSAQGNLVRLPDGVDVVAAASLGCRFATSFRALVTHGQLAEGETVAVHGCGGAGLSAVMIAKAIGARVVAVDPGPEARRRATELGADEVVDPAEHPDVAARVRELSGGGVHVSVDAVGVGRGRHGVGPVAATPRSARAGGAAPRCGRVGRAADGSRGRPGAAGAGLPRDAGRRLPRDAGADRLGRARPPAPGRGGGRPRRRPGRAGGDGRPVRGGRHHRRTPPALARRPARRLHGWA